MNFQMSETEASVDEIRLSEIEIAYKFRFPQQCKAFLLRYNGGKINPRNFTFGAEAYDGSRIDRFLAIYDGKSDNFEKYFKTYKIDAPRLPEHLIPIAHDDGGNLICIAVAGESCGAVYFWDHEYEMGEEENLFLIHPTFNEFLNSLT